MPVSILSVSVTDDAGSRHSIPIYFNGAMDPADAQTYADAFLPLLDVVTDSRIRDVTLTIPLTVVAGLKASAVQDSRNNRGVNANFHVAGMRNGWQMRIPAIDTALYDEDGFNEDDGAVTPLWAALVSGLATFQPSNEFGIDLDEFLGAEMTFHNK